MRYRVIAVLVISLAVSLGALFMTVPGDSSGEKKISVEAAREVVKDTDSFQRQAENRDDIAFYSEEFERSEVEQVKNGSSLTEDNFFLGMEEFESRGGYVIVTDSFTNRTYYQISYSGEILAEVGGPQVEKFEQTTDCWMDSEGEGHVAVKDFGFTEEFLKVLLMNDGQDTINITGIEIRSQNRSTQNRSKKVLDMELASNETGSLLFSDISGSRECKSFELKTTFQDLGSNIQTSIIELTGSFDFESSQDIGSR